MIFFSKTLNRNHRQITSAEHSFIFFTFKNLYSDHPFRMKSHTNKEVCPRAQPLTSVHDPDELSPHFGAKFSCYQGIPSAYFANGCLGLVCCISCLFLRYTWSWYCDFFRKGMNLMLMVPLVTGNGPYGYLRF